MRTERKVDAIVFDWLREGLEERLAELLRALEQLSEGQNVTEHVFDATQALQTIDRVFSMVDIQLVRVLVRTQMAALEPLEEPSDDETAISAQIESAALLQALLDRMAAGAEIAPASLLPMVNRLRGTLKQPPLEARELAARAFLLQAEHELGKRPHREKGVDEEAELRPLLRRMEREVLAVMRDDWSVLPGLRDLSMQIIAHEPSRSAIIAIRVVGELLRLTESDPDRYAPVLKRAVGRVLQLFRLQLQARSESVINHAGLDLGASVLLSMLERVDDDEPICRDRAGDWRQQLDRADVPARFVGLDAQALEAVRQALEEELLATQDVLDLFVRGKRDDLEPLGRILNKFEQMSGVLATLGYAAAAQALADGRERLQAVTRGAELLDDEMLMDLAGTVMLVEQVIDGIPRSMADGDRAEALHDQTVASSIGAIASAAFESLSEAREKINAGLAGQGDGEAPSDDPFAQAADRLTGIGEVLRLSGRDAATPLVMALARWSRAQTFGEPVGDEHALSALSEIFAALEFYLENLRDFSKEIARFLEAPKRRIDDLLGDADERQDVAASAEGAASESLSSDAEAAESDSTAEELPAAPVDDSLATPDELIAFWQVEEEELAADAPGAEREAPAADVEPVEAENPDQASGEDLEDALDFALDEGEEEQRVAPSSSDDLPDLPGEVAQYPQAAESPADLDALSLTADEPTAGDETASRPETSEDESDETALGSLPRDESSTTTEAEGETPVELDEGPSVASEDPEAAQAADQPGGDVEALTFPEATEEDSAALESALDFGLADDQDELRVDQQPPGQRESADDEGPSVDLPDQPVAAPEEAGLSTDERALAETETEGDHGEPSPSDTSASNTESADDETAALSFGETEEPSSRELESALDFGLADDQDDQRTASAASADDEMAVDLPDQPVEAPELPEAEAVDTSADEPEASLDTEAVIEPDDDPMMAEMREVFAEEMAETVPDMGEAADAWRNREDVEALITLRRGFHTIKGSGRMVGLETIGEWAWAWERLLNQVIDGKLDGDEATRQGALDAVALMQAVLPDLEAGQATPESHWSESRRLAERLESGESIEMDRSSGQAVVDSPADDEATASDGPVESDEVSSDEESTEAQAATPVIDDPVLREIFDQEIGGYIDELHREIKAAREHGVGLACDNDLVRLLHTTLGSARTAGVDIIASLARYLEDWTRVLAEHQERLGGEELALFAEGADAIEALRRWAVDPSLEQPDTRDLEQRLDIQLQQVLAEYGEVAESAEARDSRQAEEPEPPLTVEDSGAESDDVTSTDDVAHGEEVPGPSADESSSDEVSDEELPVDEAARDDLETDDVETGQAEELRTEADDSSDASGGDDEAVDEYADIEHRPDDDPAEQDEDILQIFLDEADELLEQADAYLAHWRVHPHDLESIRLLHRNLHTLKGGARMAGLLNLGDVAHHLEGRLDLARREESTDNESLVALVQHSYDVIAGLLDRVRSQQPIPQQRELIGWIRDPEGARRFAERNQGADVARPDAAGGPHRASPAPAEAAAEPSPGAPVSSPTESAEAGGGLGQEGGAERRDEQVRVAAGSIDAMVNQIGESVLLQSRIDRQVNGFERQLFELQQTVTRLRSQLRRLEIETETQIKADLMEEAGVTEEQFDPLEFDRFTQVQELSRGIMESLGDVANIEESLSSLTEQSQLLLLQQSRLGRKMQDGVLAMRLVRFNDVAGRLRRIVRQVGDEMGRQAELVIENGDAEVDRVTLMAMLPSLEHMLRNSIAHGIESPEERRAAHKPPVGRLALNIDSGGGNITVSLRDDGRGLDLDAIRRKAIERSLMPADIDISDEEARSLIFLPGFSTAGNLSQVAGRGVGMDVVASATRELGGFVDVDSEQGRYTEIRLNLPLTQAMTRGILIASGDDRYAIPYKGVVAVTRMTGVALAEHYREEKPQIEHDGEHFPLYYLGELLWGQPPAETAQDVAAIRPIMLFKLGERRFALHVDHQLGGIQLFVKSMGPQLGRIPGMSGATIADDGDVILVLELFELVQQFQRRDYQRRLGTQAALKPARARPSVLVVDDSLTVRKVTARTLERNNYDVVLARDGVEALGLLQDSLPDLVLTDIEMPRMDGFELLGAIRNDRSAADTPVIMISSRTGQKHRARAEALGVSAYLGKPYTELDLIDTIARLLPASAVSGDDEGPGDEHAH
ncbi:Hpt domain-containing protein [Guyparkeria halophila]|uniref:histidine kinase n=1 Tax=Guyparkeria halophila TaxID=47960 RepID=A0ABZ0YWU3_9GAMM|nr:Hpt domain-containing protein [Guyparkeria halophila]WQH16647.1 Hpt domain-containing protein [Guyparkeria halophila]